MLKLRCRERGTTLVEMMIATALGVSALAALASLVGYGMGINAKLLASSRLNEELGNIMSLMTRDIRRAGFHNNTLNMIRDPEANPSPFAGTLTISEFPDETLNSCILYAYDNNLDGLRNNVVGANENYGFRLRDETIEIRVNGLTCDADGWETLTDSDIVSVTALSFAFTPLVENGITSTLVSISLEGELVSDTDLSRRFDANLVVRNYE